MSQGKTPKKKIITTQKVSPTVQRVRKTSTREPQELIFKKGNYKLMGLGAALVFLGMLLMLGGKMPSADVWDDSLIYSFRRTVLAPAVILSGLVVEVFAIFKRA